MSVRFRPIQLLSVALRNQIAAGEVVDRPASAVKELVENSLDAGAHQIDVRLENGGRDLIQVQDDGSGIPKDSLELAVTRHATSKIARIDDLDAIESYGFRGEALPSIAAVSRFTLASYCDEESFAFSVNFGENTQLAPTQLAKGTRVTVADLFGNMPARLKFLKSPATETKKAEELLFRIALAHIDVGFRLSVCEREIFSFLPNDTVPMRLKAFWAHDIVDALVPFACKEDGLSIHGFAASPTKTQVRGNHIYLYVNGRVVQDKNLLGAVKEAYKGHLISKEYPQCIVFVEIDPHAVDVNVHPAKTQVRFQDERAVFASCVRAIRTAFGENSSSKNQQMQTPVHAESFDPQTGEVFEQRNFVKPENYAPRPEGFWGELDTMPIFSEKKKSYDESEQVLLEVEPKVEPKIEVEVEKKETKSWRYLGQVAATYLLFENEAHALVLLDQHAAHERIVYEKLLAKVYASQSQLLMVPCTVALESSRMQRFLAVRETLASMGFQIDLRNTCLDINGIPPILEISDAQSFIRDLLEERCDDAKTIFQRMACRAAIKAGQVLRKEEVSQLLNEWFATPNKEFCPHGRPVVLFWTTNDLEKAFKRK